MRDTHPFEPSFSEETTRLLDQAHAVMDDARAAVARLNDVCSENAERRADRTEASHMPTASTKRRTEVPEV